MKDIDFDELDRAVTSALGGASQVPADEPASTASSDPLPDEPAVDTAAPEPAVDTEPEPQTPATSPSISSHAVHARIMPSSTNTRTTLQRPSAGSVSTSEPIGDTRSTERKTSPATKRTIPHREGRFMDVVRPSQTQKEAQVPTPQSAEATGLPVPSTPTTPAPTPAPAADEPVGTPAPQPTNLHLEAAINELLVSEGHAPAPAESAPTHTEPPAAPEAPASADTQEASSPKESAVDDIAAELEQPVDTQAANDSNSPFLPDAKVEKRPLGAAESATAAFGVSGTPPAANVPPATVAPASRHLDDVAGEAEAPVPAELDKSLLQIESGAATDTSAGVDDDTVQPNDTPAKASATAGPTSIARQYKEQPRKASEDDESGAIFDPQTYHHPIEHPAKKSSGWGWVIAIVVIILIAVGAAVAAWLGGILPVAL